MTFLTASKEITKGRRMDQLALDLVTKTGDLSLDLSLISVSLVVEGDGFPQIFLSLLYMHFCACVQICSVRVNGKNLLGSSSP